MISLRRMTAQDAQNLKNWGFHSDTRYSHYDFRHYTTEDFDHWYKWKQSPPFRWIYVILNDTNVVGYATLKNFNWMMGKAEFGLVMDPGQLDKGYGTAGLKLLMAHFFKKMRMKRLCLKVSAFNQRAYTVYLKLGFEVVSSEIDPFEDQNRNFERLLNTKDFSMRGKQLVTLTHHMAISKKRYLHLLEDPNKIKNQ